MSEDEEHPFDKYMSQHGHAPRLTLKNDSQETLEVEFHRGYVSFRFYGGTNRNQHFHTFYVTRNAWLKVLRRAVPLAKHMDRQFSVRAALKRYMRQEELYQTEFKRQKRERRGKKKRW